MRILMLHHDPDGGRGGASHMAWRTADALAGAGHDVALAGTVPPGGRCPADPRRAARRLGPGLPATATEVTARAGWRPDVVHAVDLVDPIAAFRAGALARATGAVGALTPATDAELWRARAAGHRLARAAAVVFSLTAAERRSLIAAGVAPDRIAPLGQGPQLAGTPDPAAFRARVGARGPLVLFLGRALPTKGHRHLVDAAPAVLARHPTATVVVAGPDPHGDAARRIAAAGVDGLRHAGELDEVGKHSALVAADVLCLPSTADAFPLVFVEAWWCGAAVVSGPFPGAREVVRDGVDGIVTEADAAAVAAAVDGLLAAPDRRAALARAGRRRAERELGWGAVAAEAVRGYRRARPPASSGAVPATTTPK